MGGLAVGDATAAAVVAVVSLEILFRLLGAVEQMVEEI